MPFASINSTNPRSNRSNILDNSHDTQSIALLDGYSYRLEEKKFGTSFTIDFADLVPQIFKELYSMWVKWPQSFCSYWDEVELTN